MIAPSDFKWHGDDLSDAVVLPEQLAVAVYENVNGMIVVRQERAWDEDSDTLILIARENAAKVANAILAAAGISEPIPGQLLLPAPALDRTAADRQRRRREKLRAGGTA